MFTHPSQSLQTMFMSWHQGQGYTECHICWVQCPPKIFLLPVPRLITRWPRNVACAAGLPPSKIDRHQPAHHVSSPLKKHCHIITVTSILGDELCVSTLCTVHQQPPSTRPILDNHSLQVHLQTSSNITSRWISKLAELRPSGSPDHNLQVHL